MNRFSKITKKKIKIPFENDDKPRDTIQPRRKTTPSRGTSPCVPTLNILLLSFSSQLKDDRVVVASI